MISLSTFSSFGSFEFDGFSVDESNAVKKRIIHLKSVSPSGKCPCCHTESNAKHSYYVRNLKDLSWSDSSVEVSLKVKKFYCKNIHCSRKIFTERFTQEIQPYARSTTRLQHQLMVLGLTIGVRALQRISSHLQLEYSNSSLLRFAHLFQVNDTNKLTINCLGIDDWAFKKQVSYGTILVNLETRQPIALLPDRKVETVSNWLLAHPEIKIITRDGSSSYASAATKGAPQAAQISDKWHLLDNLSAVIRSYLEGYKSDIRTVCENISANEHEKLKSTLLSQKIELPDTKYSALFKKVKELQKEGKLSQRKIAKELGMNRDAV